MKLGYLVARRKGPHVNLKKACLGQPDSSRLNPEVRLAGWVNSEVRLAGWVNPEVRLAG